jgi:hypothetical protein
MTAAKKGEGERKNRCRNKFGKTVGWEFGMTGGGEMQKRHYFAFYEGKLHRKGHYFT